MGYRIIDTKTGNQVKVCPTLRSASRACDKLDNEYGAVRYRYQFDAGVCLHTHRVNREQASNKES